MKIAMQKGNSSNNFVKMFPLEQSVEAASEVEEELGLYWDKYSFVDAFASINGSSRLNSFPQKAFYGDRFAALDRYSLNRLQVVLEAEYGKYGKYYISPELFKECPVFSYGEVPEITGGVFCEEGEDLLTSELVEIGMPVLWGANAKITGLTHKQRSVTWSVSYEVAKYEDNHYFSFNWITREEHKWINAAYPNGVDLLTENNFIKYMSEEEEGSIITYSAVWPIVTIMGNRIWVFPPDCHNYATLYGAPICPTGVVTINASVDGEKLNPITLDILHGRLSSMPM